MLTGRVHRTRALTDKCGKTITLTVRSPDDTPENRAELLAASRLWASQARALLGAHRVPAHRAFFAGDVAFLASRGYLGKCPPRCILVAQDDKGVIRGVSTYSLDERRGVWHLEYMTTDPPNQHGNPNTCPIRGIGAELLGASAADMSGRLCATVELEALDKDAERYWRARGFHNTEEPLNLSCPELRTLSIALAHTPHDYPDRGDLVAADWPEHRRRYSLRVPAGPPRPSYFGEMPRGKDITPEQAQLRWQREMARQAKRATHHH